MAVVAAVGLGLTGCSDPGTPSDTLPPAASTSAEPTLEPLGPADFPVPAEARENTEAGAVAAAKYYFDLEGQAAQSLDTTWIRELTLNCASCDEAASLYESDRVAGNRYEGGEGVVTAFLDGTQPDGSVSVGILIEQAPFQLLGPDGSVVTGGSVPARRLSGGALLVWDASRSAWLVTSYDLSPTS